MAHTFPVLLLLLAATPALAHPGAHHGTLSDAIAHLLSAPDHVALMAAAGVAGVLGTRRYRRRSRTRAQGARRQAD